MNAMLKIGAFLSLVGFVTVGSAMVYGSNAGAVSLQDAVQAAKNSGTAQGIGWIIVGLGIAIALFGLGSAVHDLATVVPDIAGLRSVASARKETRIPAKARAEFVCSDCGGDLSLGDKTCPHCGAPIEGD